MNTSVENEYVKNQINFSAFFEEEKSPEFSRKILRIFRSDRL